MSELRIAELPDRGLVSVTGEDARRFLDNLITNDMDQLDGQDAIFAALLTPQGKILFEFFVVRAPAGYLLETARAETAALAKRLGMYKLRARVEIKDVSDDLVVAVCIGGQPALPEGVIAFNDPRAAVLGRRLLIPAPLAAQVLASAGAERMTMADWAACRVAAGVPEAGADYPLGDTFPHEANFDRLGGVSFTKGCFVGQEVVARMQNKTVVRKRIARISAGAPLHVGAEVRAGEAVVGKVGTVAGGSGLAMVRLDRITEAEEKGLPVTADGVPVTIDAAALAAYRASLAERAGSA